MVLLKLLMKEYQTHYFEDSGSGRKKMQKFLGSQARLGWKLSSSQISQQGYSAFKTAFWGKIFLPLALLGRKKNSIQVIMERDSDAGTANYSLPQSPVDRALSQLPADLPYVRSHLKAYIIVGAIVIIGGSALIAFSEGPSSTSPAQSVSPTPTKAITTPTTIPTTALNQIINESSKSASRLH